MAEMKDFNKDFVNRTIKLLKRKDDEKDLEVTLLLNCMLGMVVLPIERYKNDKEKVIINNYMIKCVKKLKQLAGQTFKTDPENESETKIFCNIRNSIAHLNVTMSSYKGQIEKVTLKNYKTGNKRKETLSYTLSIDNLREFAIYIAEEYLKLEESGK